MRNNRIAERQKGLPSAVFTPKLASEDNSSPPRPVLHLTQADLDDLDLLCYSLGAGKNAAINFATKYLCSLWLYSTLPVKVPRPLKPSSTNPPLTVEYGLNPEVLAAVKAVRGKRKELQSVPEADIVKPAILYLCKKLLPAKSRRLPRAHFRKEGVL